MKTQEITFTAMNVDGDSSRTMAVDPDDPATLAAIEAEFAELMSDGRAAFVAGGGQIRNLEPDDLPREVLILAPMVGG